MTPSTGPTIDVDRIRGETPCCEQRAYFNNAGAALQPRVVRDTVAAHLEAEQSLGGYVAEEEAQGRLEDAYRLVARLVGAADDEIAFTDSGTRAWGTVFYGLRFRPGDRILTSNAEYVSNFLAMQDVARRAGAEIVIVPNDESGAVGLTELESSIDDRTRLIALTHVPSSSGLVNPAVEVGRIARAAGVPYLLDACQSIGQMPIDVEAIGCDFLTAAGRKFLRGPRGTGLLFVRRSRLDAIEPPMIDFHGARLLDGGRVQRRDDARRFELFEFDVAARLGLAAAVDYALSIGIASIWARITMLASRLRDGLAGLPDVVIRDPGDVQCGIVTFTMAGFAAADVRRQLWQVGFNVWISRVQQAPLDLGSRGLEAVVRTSVHYYNTVDEIDRLIGAVESLAP